MVKDLGFCKVQIYQNYLICVVEEGITLTVEEIQKLTQNVLDQFENRPFVYITHRINSYAVKPEVYTNALEIDNLIGFAVVSTNHLALKNAEIEKLFFKKPFEIFKQLDDAKLWADKLVTSSSAVS